jgi:hypothetical protein
VSFVGASVPIVTGTNFIFVRDPTEAREQRTPF